MCLACEQDAIWLAYLESRGLLNPDDPAAVEKLFADFPVQPLPMQEPEAKPDQNQSEERASAPATAGSENGKNPFSCDDPTAG